MAIQNTFYLDVDIKRDNYVEEPQVTQNDSVKFVLRVTDDGADYGMANASTYTLASLRPDGQSVLTIGSLTAPNEVTFELGSTEVSVPGRVKAAIQLYDAEGRVSSIPFTYEVTKDIAVDYVPSADDRTLIQLVLGEGPAILANAEAATSEALAAAEIARNAVGPMGPQGPKGETGATGPIGPKGETGATGPRGEVGPVGPKGDKGNDGTGVTILGSFANESELPVSGNLGDAYLISGSLYVWNGSAWENVGNIQGPQGIPGVPGETGPVGPKGEPGETPDVSIFATKSEVGDVTTLTTTAKKVVAAINEINAKPTGGDTTEIAKQINTLYDLTTGLIRYRAYDELQKQAEGILEDGRGTVFAHDMNGNIIGMTLDEANSQNIVIRDGKMMMLAKAEVTRTVTNGTVVASAYETGGSGGRKIVRLSDGSQYAVVRNGSTDFRIYKSTNSWSTPGQLFVTVTEFTNDVCLATDGKYIFVLSSYSTTGTRQRTYSLKGVLIGGIKDVDTGQSAMGNCYLNINQAGTELYAASSSKNSTYNSSFNIRYAKGLINQLDGSVTWGAVEQVTKQNAIGYDLVNPNVVISNIEIILIYSFITNTFANKRISMFRRKLDGSDTWHYTGLVGSINYGGGIYEGGAHPQLSPSALYAPRLADGVIAVTWHGKSSAYPSVDYIQYAASFDGGVTFSIVSNVIQGINPSLSVNGKDRFFITYEDGGVIKRIESNTNGISWGNPISVGAGTDPSSIFTLSLDYSEPLTVRKGATSVLFSGTWTALEETPTLTARAVYNVPSTDYVGAFVKKTGTATVQAYVNDTLVDAELVDNEYGFTKQLATEAPVKLRLDLSRTSTSGGESDAVTRILGGRA